MQRRDSEIGRGRGRGGPGGPPYDRMGNRGGGGAGDFGNGGGGGWDRRPGGMQQGGGQMDKQEATFTIPAAKCGIVIGRGNYIVISSQELCSITSKVQAYSKMMYSCLFIVSVECCVYSLN